MFLIREAYFKKRLEQRISRFQNYIKQPRQWILTWYFGYGLLGMISNGVLPVLLPLMVADYSHHLGWVGLIAGAFSLGSLSSIIWGKLADRYHLHRQIYFGAYGLLIIIIAVISLLTSLWFWMLLSFAAGASIAAASTVASLFIVEYYPQKEWEPRLAWLQTFSGAGQVIGLMVAGAFVVKIHAGFFASAIMLLPALWLDRKALPGFTTPHIPYSSIVKKRPAIRDFHFLGLFARPEHQSINLHYPAQKLLSEMKKIKGMVYSRFGLFLFSWFMLYFGIAAFFAYFPVILRKSYAVPPSVTALTYSVSAGASLVLYTFGAKLAAKYGSARVYRWGLFLRLVGFAIIFTVFFLPITKTYIALAGFICIIVAWPLLLLTGTDLAAKLSPVGEGTAMGLFNTTAGIATVTGTFLSGPLIQYGGDAYLSGLAVLSIGLAWVLAGPLDNKKMSQNK